MLIPSLSHPLGVKGFRYLKLERNKKVLECIGDAAKTEKGLIEVFRSFIYTKGMEITVERGIFKSRSFRFFRARVQKKGFFLKAKSIWSERERVFMIEPTLRMDTKKGVAKVSGRKGFFEERGKKRIFCFEGHSSFFSPSLVLSADRIVFEIEGSELSLVKAFGNVHLRAGSKKAACKSFLWDTDREEMRLEGDVVVNEGGSVFKSQKVIYLPKKGIFKSGGSKRIRFLLR